MKNIMFVCHGNICRSPMAEFIMKSLAGPLLATDDFHIESSATSREEIGNGIYPPAAHILSLHNVECKGHVARQITKSDYDKSDMVIVMEDYNIANLRRAIGPCAEDKVWKLLDFVGDNPQQCSGGDISDPWYHGNFEKTYNEILTGCKALMRYLGY